MVRKENIIKSLEMMGYTVTVDNAIYSVSLEIGDRRYKLLIDETDIIFGTFVIEKIVRAINDRIINDKLEGGDL